MKTEKALLIYPELCIACRACQVACKQWNQLAAEPTTNQGTYENPLRLSQYTYLQIQFRELKTPQGIQWLFVKHQCHHCTEAACILVCPVKGAIIRTEEGAVILNPDKCIGCGNCVNTCPFEVPQFDRRKKVSKCNLCYHRIIHGHPPVCAQVCPTGATRFGEREDLLQEAKLSGCQTIYGKEEAKGMHVIFALPSSAEQYGLPAHPEAPKLIIWWKRILKPLVGKGIGVVFLGALFHYLYRRSGYFRKSGDTN